jgi:hypothetical protein
MDLEKEKLRELYKRAKQRKIADYFSNENSITNMARFKASGDKRVYASHNASFDNNQLNHHFDDLKPENYDISGRKIPSSHMYYGGARTAEKQLAMLP